MKRIILMCLFLILISNYSFSQNKNNQPNLDEVKQAIKKCYVNAPDISRSECVEALKSAGVKEMDQFLSLLKDKKLYQNTRIRSMLLYSIRKFGKPTKKIINHVKKFAVKKDNVKDVEMYNDFLGRTLSFENYLGFVDKNLDKFDKDQSIHTLLFIAKHQNKITSKLLRKKTKSIVIRTVSEIENYINNSDHQIYAFGQLNTFNVRINTKKPPFSDAEVVKKVIDLTIKILSLSWKVYDGHIAPHQILDHFASDYTKYIQDQIIHLAKDQPSSFQKNLVAELILWQGKYMKNDGWKSIIKNTVQKLHLSKFRDKLIKSENNDDSVNEIYKRVLKKEKSRSLHETKENEKKQGKTSGS